MPNIQQFSGAAVGDYNAPDPAYQQLRGGPVRIAQYQQDWRGFGTWNMGMGLEHYPPVHRAPIEPLPSNALYLQRNPAPYTTASPIPIGQYVISQQMSYNGNGGNS